MPWFVLYTKSRSEKLVARQLEQRGVEVYCPLRVTKRKWSDRYKLVEEPLFRSYCFVHLEERERSRVFNVPGVVGYLHWLKKPAIVRQSEIDLIKDMLNDFDHDALEIMDIRTADRLRILSGSLMDQEVDVVATQGHSVSVRIDALNICIWVDLSRNKVERIGRSADLSRRV